jgi:GNAT superfamily N-acetyltransferase
MLRLLVPAVALLLTAGCSSINDEPLRSSLDRAMNTGLKQVSERARFDPYAAEVHALDREVAPIWKQTLREVQSAAEQAGYQAKPLDELCGGGWGSCETWMERWVRPSLTSHGVPTRRQDAALQQLRERGWAVIQRENATGELHHGEYRVPTMVYAFFFFYKVANADSRGFSLDFEIVGKDARLSPAAAPPAPAPAASPPSQGSAEERLRKLKKLLDDGVITPAEHERRRGEIINSL